jgi:TonB-dependent receptor
MRKTLFSVLLMALLSSVFGLIPAHAQERKGTITGRVTDESHRVLQGARIELQPKGQSAVADAQGDFTIYELSPGTYTVTVSYVGLAPFSTDVKVTSGDATRLDAELKVDAVAQSIVVTAERSYGEAEAINLERTADNIVQVLPAEVITSLPNANVADALGRLPSVTLERDEGEGKYVQIRGTEPRLSNTTIDGVNVPSPESGVRQIKLDVLASDLVSSVQINKTLQANQDADGIGGSVNLVTKTAGEAPTINIFGIGGYTPIIGGRGVAQSGATIGKRFGASKRLGVLIGGTYDYNGRGINDIEPVPTAGSASPHYASIDLRDYKYYRTRWGGAGSVDYKLAEDSSIYARTFYSRFRDWGNKWVYTLVDGDVPQLSQDWRRPDYAVGSLVIGGHHVFSASRLVWDLSVSRSRQLGGSGGADYNWSGGAVNCTDDPAATTDVYLPQFSASCFTPGTSNVLDRANYTLADFSLPTSGHTAQLNLQASASYARNYHVSGHFGSFEFGGKIRNAHKFDDTYNQTWTVKDGVTIPADQFASDFTDPTYYNSSYKFGNTVDYTKVQSYVSANPGSFDFSGGPGTNSHNYDLIERVSAGYLMNSIDLTSRIHLITGVRFEATNVNTLSFDKGTNTLSFQGGGSYLDVLPSASLRFALTKDSGLRIVYGRGLSRPNPSDITKAVGQPNLNQTPPTVSLGNPDLKPEHANNFDVLYEQYLKPLGMIQAGFFYKDLSDPIIATQVKPTTGPFAGYLVSQPGNAGSAYLAGFELAYQQHLTFLPGPLNGIGIAANYSYTVSAAHGLPGRSDSPALLRQAPNTWNISPTYDRGRLSVRLGLSYNGANIYQYQWADNADPTGIKGPSGDNYLYAHLQVDAQGSFRVKSGLSAIVYGLNLTNEVFGFYNGSPQYVVQREFYKPTIAGGFRWTSQGGR